MADNFLEKHFAEYEQRKAAWLKKRRCSKKPPQKDARLHAFSEPIDAVDMPAELNDPFCYQPHPLCLMAARDVQRFVGSKAEWSDELGRGKMFGVLAVRDRDGSLGFLAAFSGLLDGRNDIPYFVPPVYDLLQPQGFFKIEEAEISQLNARIDSLRQSDAYRSDVEALSRLHDEADSVLGALKSQMAEAKARRDKLRQGSLADVEEEELTRESQRQKAEYRRTEREWRQRLEVLRQRVGSVDDEIDRLKHERHERSAALQERLFRHFVMLGSDGRRQDLCQIFDQARGQLPPAGAGECAAPKLLQYAFKHGMKPLAIAEFWWGASPKDVERVHGRFYPACEGKCRPILDFMLHAADTEKG